MKKKDFWLILGFAILMIVLAVVNSGCYPVTLTPPPFTPTPTSGTLMPTEETQPPEDTPTPEFTPIPTFDPLDWENHPTTDTWPKVIDGAKVCYVWVKSEKTLLRDIKGYNIGGKPIFGISTVKGLRPGQDGLTAQRVIAKYGEFVMVYYGGDNYGVAEKTCRPFTGDGGNLAYLVMYEQDIDGIYIGSHPGVPLYILYEDVEYFNPWD